MLPHPHGLVAPSCCPAVAVAHPVLAGPALIPLLRYPCPSLPSANKSINRFALVRKLSSDKTGIFNSRLWDGMARK